MGRMFLAAGMMVFAGCASFVAKPTTAVRITFDGTTQTFAHCTLSSESQAIELRDGSGAIHISPGNVKFSNLVCVRPLTPDKVFWQWRRDVERGTVGRKNLEVVFLEANREVARFAVFRAWIAAARVVGDGADHHHHHRRRSHIPIEQIEIAHEGIERQ